MGIYKYNGITINSEDVTIEDMPTELFKEIYELCGADVALSLLTNMCGNIIQVPSKGFVNIIKKFVLKIYDGTPASLRKIARKFSIPELQVRRILTENRIRIPDKNPK